ncbi:MAG: membrane protein insertion efficiency factor YidD [Thiothrix sp.]|uniref:membrane protein insertion efficiency factor YidD n=1 Tax=Thiothrix sp. TaxID=1032 RepID=UPI002604AFB0|nr:membrane protein insertion efficiency factor YidD [Thiothrix sp.]MDD5393863.1 membrane protein insertion efficiency factor YidD [Thiothrix sp.]
MIGLELISFLLHLPSSGIRFLLQKLFVFYQTYISPHKGYQCACHTHNGEASCSDHALHVLETYPLLTAIHLIWQRSRHCRAVSKQHGFTLKHMYLRHGIAVAGIVALTGCGGGGGGGGGGDTTPPPTPTTLSGKFLLSSNGTDIAAGGIAYTLTSAAGASSAQSAMTATIAAQTSGITDANGSFSYVAGDSISFSIGGRVFSVPAATKITAQELATPLCSGNPDFVKCRNTTTENIERFLIGWDVDHNPNNGVNFSSAASAPTVAFTSDQFADALAVQLAKEGISPPATFKPSLGMNTEAPQAEQNSIAQAVPFVDIFRVARPFKELSSCGSGSIDYDANGWPVPAANSTSCTIRTVLVNNATAENIPAGIYTVLYDGKGTLEYGNDASLVPGSNNIQGKEEITISFNNGGMINLSIKTTDVHDPIRNIRIIMPGGICEGNPFVRVADASHCPSGTYRDFAETLKTNSDPTKGRNAIVFNPDYLRFMKDFRVIRMMNLMEASPSKNACTGLTGNAYSTCLLQDFTWAQRAQMDAATWGGSTNTPLLERYGRGVPLEVAVELANQLNAHPWFNIPHNATDDYVTRFADYVEKHLKHELKAHIEYTNEAWNPIFWGSLYVRKKGMDLGLGAGYDNYEYWAGALYYAKRATEIFQKWENVFGDNSRLVRILGTVQTDIYLTRNMLNYGDTKNHVDAVAMNAYFLACQKRPPLSTPPSTHVCNDRVKIPKTLDEVTTLDEVFAAIDNTYDPYGLPALRTLITNQAAEAARFGKALYAYEGGQHLTVDGDTDAIRRTLFEEANLSPEMGVRYTTLLNAWKDAGGQQFMLYTQPQSFHTWGLFGIKRSLNERRSSAPKYDASMTFQETQGKCWWCGS